MYKDKFQHWGFAKKISHKVVGKLSRIIDERKPKETKFRLGPRVWTASEIKKKNDRGPKDSGQTTQGSTIRNPELE